MHKITELQLNSLMEELHQKLRDESGTIVSEASRSGRAGGYIASRLCDFGFIEAKRLVEQIINVEKSAISTSRKMPPNEYFEQLKGELSTWVDGLYQVVASKAKTFAHSSRTASQDIAHIEEDVNDKRTGGIIRMKNVVDIMKAKLENEFSGNAYSNPTPKDSATLIVPDFKFIKIADLIPLLKRDYGEIAKSMENKCWKSVIVICGSSIEGILYDLLKQHETKALAAKAKKGKEPLEDWGIAHLVDTSLELNLITGRATKLSHAIREYRNLIHIAKELIGTDKLEEQEATIAKSFLDMLIRDLSSPQGSHP